MSKTKLIATKTPNGKTKLIASQAAQAVLPGLDGPQDQPKGKARPKAKVIPIGVKPKGKAKPKAKAVKPKAKPILAAPKVKPKAKAKPKARTVKPAPKAKVKPKPKAKAVKPAVRSTRWERKVRRAKARRRLEQVIKAIPVPEPKAPRVSSREYTLPEIPRQVHLGMNPKRYTEATLRKINRIFIRGQQTPRYGLYARGVNGAVFLVAYTSSQRSARYLRRKARSFARRVLNQRYAWRVIRLSRAQRKAVA